MASPDIPRPLDPAAADALRDAAARVGVRRLAAALDVSRHTLLMAMAGLPLERVQHQALDDGAARVFGPEPPPPRAA
jgi:hypothetical protein